MSVNYEKGTVQKMIQLYCRLNHGEKQLCPECRKLNDYAQERLNKCPFGDDKPACKKCTVHCYQDERKKRIKEVMRFSGPRMLWYHPFDFLKHLFK